MTLVNSFKPVLWRLNTFTEVSIESLPQWNLNPRPLNSNQMLSPTEPSSHGLNPHSEPTLYSYSNFIFCSVSDFIPANASTSPKTYLKFRRGNHMSWQRYKYTFLHKYIKHICTYTYVKIVTKKRDRSLNSSSLFAKLWNTLKYFPNIFFNNRMMKW